MFSSITNKNLARNISKLLEQERKIISAGAFYKLSTLVERREKLVEKLVSGDIVLTKEDVNHIQRQARRNCNLLEASLNGINLARKMVSDARSKSDEIGTYTHTGKRMKTTVTKDLGRRNP